MLAELAPDDSRGARPDGTDGAAGVAHGGARRCRGRPVLLMRAGPHALGPAADPPRAGRAGARRMRCGGSRSGRYALQAAIAACHARARTAPRTPIGRASSRCTTRWRRSRRRRWCELNRAVAVGMAFGPAAALEIVDALQRRRRAARLPVAAQRARRPAGQARPQRRGARRIRTRRRPRTATRASANCCWSARRNFSIQRKRSC